MSLMNGLGGLRLEGRVFHSPSVRTSHNEGQMANTQNRPVGTFRIGQNHNGLEIELNHDFVMIDKRECP